MASPAAQLTTEKAVSKSDTKHSRYASCHENEKALYLRKRNHYHKMTAMAAELERQTGDASYRELSMEERLSLIVNAEWNRRQNNKINRLSNAAHFAQPGVTIEGIEYFEDRKLDKSLLLRLSTCKYIESGHHIILKGASGNGKTYLACALGNAACRNLKTVRYIRMPELLDALN